MTSVGWPGMPTPENVSSAGAPSQAVSAGEARSIFLKSGNLDPKAVQAQPTSGQIGYDFFDLCTCLAAADRAQANQRFSL